MGPIVLAIAVISFGALRWSTSRHASASAVPDGSTLLVTPAEALSSSSKPRASYDIALLNLLAAEALAGSEHLNIPECIQTLDQWSDRAKSETERHLYRFRQNPAEYEYSEAYFRMLMMAVVLCEDFGIRYNPERVVLPENATADYSFFSDSSDVFIHGLCGSRRMGTCSSMPVLYAAISRRLGYPIKLVTTKAHIFLRWEDSRERFNLEATGKGMNKYHDAHYRHWPFPVSDAEIRTCGYLKSLNPDEEFALFLSLRGNCLRAHGRLDEAAAAYAQAARLAPDCAVYKALLADTQESAAKGTAVSSQVAIQSSERYSASGSPGQPVPPGLPTDPNPLLQLQQRTQPPSLK